MLGDTALMDWGSFVAGGSSQVQPAVSPLPPTVITVRDALEVALMRHTAVRLQDYLLNVLKLPLPKGVAVDPAWTKREVVQHFTFPMELPTLMHLASRVVTEIEPDDGLSGFVERYRRGGGVMGAVKNLIFAADGPKPELVLVDALNNTIKITRHAEHCLVYDRGVPAGGLSFRDLIGWWRERELLDDVSDREVALVLHARLMASMGNNEAEKLLFTTYATRYRSRGYDIPALVPQVYLHYDPLTLQQRGPAGSPLARQRMDFLLLFSDRRRVVLEVDGRHHYATNDGRADTKRYAAMVVEDRRLRLAGYEVYRFGGKELEADGAPAMLTAFFDDLERQAGA